MVACFTPPRDSSTRHAGTGDGMKLAALAFIVVVGFGFASATAARATYRGSMGQIAYLGSSGRLMVDDPLDDSPPRQLVPAQPTGMYEGGLPFSSPAWSPD